MHRLSVACVLLTGCTLWSTTTVYGQMYEVERQLLGSPAIEESSSSDLHGGFSTASERETDRSRHHSFTSGIHLGSFGGSTSSNRMTHCVQQAQIHYKQPYQIVPEAHGRWLDVAGAVAAIAVGGTVMMIANVQSQSAIPPNTPGFANPPSATPGLVVGGAIALGGVALLAYSFGRLPRGTPPKVESHEDDVVQTEWVEATGCGLPGDPTADKAAAH